MALESKYPRILTDDENNTGGNKTLPFNVETLYDLYHHSHEGLDEASETATSTQNASLSLVEAVTMLSEVVAGLGGDTSEVDVKLAEVAEALGYDEDEELNADLPESTTTFSYTYATEEEAAAAVALTAAVEDEETESEFDAVVDDESVLTEYLGCYEVTAETGVLTLASPVEVTDPEVYTAIVLHYNDETGEWEQVSDVQIIDGYVYAVFESLSPVAVYLVKKKYPVSVTVGDETTNYETIAEAVSAAMENVSNVVTITLNWNVVVNETVGPLYNDGTADNVVTLDLNGYSLIGEGVDGYVVSVVGTGSTQKLMITNGTIIADENTTGALYVEKNYVALENVALEGSKPGCAVLEEQNTRVYPTGCTINSTNGICIQMSGDEASGVVLTTSTEIVQTQTDDTEGNAAIVLLASKYAQTMNINADTTITSDVCGVKNLSSTSKVYAAGPATITAPIAIYVGEACTSSTYGFYTGTADSITVNGSIDANGTAGSRGVALKIGVYSEEPDAVFIANGYEVSANTDGTWTVAAGEYVQITKADGTVIVTNLLTATSLYDGCTVKLLHDISSTGLTINYASTIDLNGYTYTVTSSAGLYTNKDVEVTIKNGKLVSTNSSTAGMAIGVLRGTVHVVDMEIENEAGHGIVVGNNSKDYDAVCDISGKTTINVGGTGVFIQNKSGNAVVPSVTIEDGVVVEGDAYAVSGNGSYDNTTIVINGGTFKCTGTDGAALYHPQAGTLTINGGTFEAACAGIQICDGNAVINDATVVVTGSDEYMADKTGDGDIPDGAALSVVNRSGYSSTYPTLKVYGGKFSGQYALRAYSWASNAKSDWADAGSYIDVYGGDFSEAIDSAYLAEGYECATEATDGFYTVKATA